MKISAFLTVLALGLSAGPLRAVDFDGVARDNSAVVLPEVPAAVAGDAAGAVRVTGASYKEGVRINIESSLDAAEVMLALCEGDCGSGKVLEERIVKSKAAGKFSETLLPGKILPAGSYSVGLAYRKTGAGNRVEGRQLFGFQIGEVLIKEMVRTVRFNAEDYTWEGIPCSKKDEKTYRQETEWKIMKKDKTDYYVCDLEVTYEGYWYRCHESNPHTDPGICVCAAVERKTTQTLTNNCHWEAQWW